MILLPYSRPWEQQPTDERIDWTHPRAVGLEFAASLSALGVRDLVSGRPGTLTGLAASLPASGRMPLVYRQFGASNYADFTAPARIGATTPFTIAWTQEARSTSAYSSIVHINFGTAGADRPFLIYQSASDANYYFAAGPSSGSNQARWATAIGAVTNNRLDRYVLRCAGGSQSTTLTDYTLYRNGQLVTRDGTGIVFGGLTTGGFRIGALLTGSDPWEGLIGDLRLWGRLLSEEESAEESLVDQVLVLYEPQRIWVPVSAAGGGAFALVMGQGSYALTGQDVALLAQRAMVAGQGSYALAGQDVGLLVQYPLVMGQGSYALTGQDVALTYTPAGASTLAMGQGSYTLTGQDVSLLAQRLLVVEQGGYALTGQSAGLYVQHALTAESGSYTLTGRDLQFSRNYALSAGYGAYTLAGQVVTLTFTGLIAAYLETVRLRSRITQSVALQGRISPRIALRSQVRH